MGVGLISVLCAIGTVVGLALLVFGFARKAKVMKVSGALTFLLCFGGLFYILAKYGYRPEGVSMSAGAEQWKIIKWSEEVLQSDSSYQSINLLQTWNSAPVIIIDENLARIGSGSTAWMQRDFSRTDSTWSFGSSAEMNAPPLTGNFRASGDKENEVLLLKELENRRESIWLVRAE